MKGKDLYQAMQYIDDKLVENAVLYLNNQKELKAYKAKRNKIIISLAACAAGITLLVALAGMAHNRIQKPNNSINMFAEIGTSINNSEELQTNDKLIASLPEEDNSNSYEDETAVSKIYEISQQMLGDKMVTVVSENKNVKESSNGVDSMELLTKLAEKGKSRRLTEAMLKAKKEAKESGAEDLEMYYLVELRLYGENTENQKLDGSGNVKDSKYLKEIEDYDTLKAEYERIAAMTDYEIYFVEPGAYIINEEEEIEHYGEVWCKILPSIYMLITAEQYESFPINENYGYAFWLTSYNSYWYTKYEYRGEYTEEEYMIWWRGVLRDLEERHRD